MSIQLAMFDAPPAVVKEKPKPAREVVIDAWPTGKREGLRIRAYRKANADPYQPRLDEVELGSWQSDCPSQEHIATGYVSKSINLQDPEGCRRAAAALVKLADFLEKDPQVEAGKGEAL